MHLQPDKMFLYVLNALLTAQFVQVAEEACSPANFNPSTLPFITLISKWQVCIALMS